MVSGPVNLFFIRLFPLGGPIFKVDIENGAGTFGISSSSSDVDLSISSISSVAFRFLSETAEADLRRGDLGLGAAAFPRVDFLFRESTVCLEARPRLGGEGEGERSISCSP